MTMVPSWNRPHVAATTTFLPTSALVYTAILTVSSSKGTALCRVCLRYSPPIVRCAALVLATAAFMTALGPDEAAAIEAAKLERAKLATIGVPRHTGPAHPDKPGKILVRGTGFHLRDGWSSPLATQRKSRTSRPAPPFRNRFAS